ncbi:UNVERIFIED_CONTAM: hypothetical protein GTU68_012182 [Idotea baltica]|nr:hypothetical protein [Idotea baltica]
MAPVLETIGRLAEFRTSVLIKGESGTGKELVARELHGRSKRSSSPFIALNCGAIPEKLLESELFGHKRGSFTDATEDRTGLLQEADGGTIFLDEIGEMPLSLQVKLLRVIQESEVRPVGASSSLKIDVRFVAASLKDLEVEVAENRFREDLFYRLKVVEIELPPLRERRGDIPLLVDHIISRFNQKHTLEIIGITPETLSLFEAHSWPGNIRELENVIEQMMILSEGPLLLDTTVPELRRPQSEESSFRSEDNLSVKFHTAELEKKLIQEALSRTKGNRTKAAKLLDMSQRALLYKLKGYGLDENSPSEDS